MPGKQLPHMDERGLSFRELLEMLWIFEFISKLFIESGDDKRVLGKYQDLGGLKIRHCFSAIDHFLYHSFKNLADFPFFRLNMLTNVLRTNQTLALLVCQSFGEREFFIFVATFFRLGSLLFNVSLLHSRLQVSIDNFWVFSPIDALAPLILK
jgi:hypothetical protein